MHGGAADRFYTHRFYKRGAADRFYTRRFYNRGEAAERFTPPPAAVPDSVRCRTIVSIRGVPPDPWLDD